MAIAQLSYMLLSLLFVGIAAQQIPLGYNAKPNIVFILTDDQDLHMDSLDYMPLLQKLLLKEGTFYKRHYCSTAICCPSRVTLWTGRNAHNTNVTDVSPPYGGYPKFVSQGFNDNYLPVWLREAGYNTFYTGKLFNAHTVANYDKPYPAGWTSSDFLLDPYTYQYLNATTQRNRDAPVSWEGHYSTDVLATKAYGLLDEALALEEPFFLTIAPSAPHSNVALFDPIRRDSGIPGMTMPVAAKRHEHLFPNAKVPRTENFNPSKAGGVSWIKRLDRLNETVIDYNDQFYRARLQALQAVDEIVEGIVERLAKAGILDNTYVIYSTDNGFHIGQHRLNPGKECGFEEDINIPLIIRGPGVPAGQVAEVVTAHTDLAPTFLKIAGAKHRSDIDGSAIPLDTDGLVKAEAARQEHVNVEFWGWALPEGDYGFSYDDGKIVNLQSNNTYKGLRLVSKEHNLYYSVWCTNEHELYDLNADPHQMNNIYPQQQKSTKGAESSNRLSSVSNLERLISRLDALLMVTKSCKGRTCVSPWGVLHPDGDVKTLKDALDQKFDSFYSFVGQRVRFDRCELGYIIESEGPQAALQFGVDY
ncbi:MAG: hypothetical protein M1818_002609 [Claussenomyces sp. TS43310]|nr:MAG: hypothetical protein M1818_002609 [Claussenomyces sp. TS43310]